MALIVCRSGSEFARPYLIAERPRLRVSSAPRRSWSSAWTTLFTGVLLVTLLAVPDGTPGVRVLRTGGVIVSLAFAALLAFLVLGYRNRALAVRLPEALLADLAQDGDTRAGMLDAFIHGLRLVPSRSKLALFFLLTAAYWAVNAWGIARCARLRLRASTPWRPSRSWACSSWGS